MRPFGATENVDRHGRITGETRQNRFQHQVSIADETRASCGVYARPPCYGPWRSDRDGEAARHKSHHQPHTTRPTDLHRTPSSDHQDEVKTMVGFARGCGRSPRARQVPERPNVARIPPSRSAKSMGGSPWAASAARSRLTGACCRQAAQACGDPARGRGQEPRISRLLDASLNHGRVSPEPGQIDQTPVRGRRPATRCSTSVGKQARYGPKNRSSSTTRERRRARPTRAASPGCRPPAAWDHLVGAGVPPV